VFLIDSVTPKKTRTKLHGDFTANSPQKCVKNDAKLSNYSVCPKNSPEFNMSDLHLATVKSSYYDSHRDEPNLLILILNVV